MLTAEMPEDPVDHGGLSCVALGHCRLTERPNGRLSRDGRFASLPDFITLQFDPAGTCGGLRRSVAAERQGAKKEDVTMKNDYETVIFHVE
jgi:hypothetical protein